LALAAEGIDLPKVLRPKQMRINAAFQAFELASEYGVQTPFLTDVYLAYWEQGARIGDVDVLVGLANRHGIPEDDLRDAVANRRFADRIVHFDEPTYAMGVYNVPTFFIGGERYAEQPYRVLAEAIREALG
jgi:predicted DsbA family dithiol-disulfide isomerase